ncbi:MAG: hypothetical protein NC823_00230 [Candidatus Omnitrophica bacterium]|nr:hypothetical protein [Candidatus Omnitrophota bacterium]
MERIIIKPHRFVDIITGLVAETLSLPHPYSHTLYKVTLLLLSQPAITLLLTGGPENICQPCSHLINGLGNDTIDTSRLTLFVRF